MLGRRSPRVTRIQASSVWMTRPPVTFCTLLVVQAEPGAKPGDGERGLAGVVAAGGVAAYGLAVR